MQAMIINGLGAIPGTGMESLANRIGTESFDSTENPLPLRPERFGLQRGELRLDVGDQGLRNAVPSTMIRN
jgi:hypothetical protein